MASSDSTSPGRILLVDDEASMLRAFERVLAAEGYLVKGCSDAASALERFSEQTFDAIVSDISMPDLSGIDLLRAVRLHDLDVPVILVTGAPALESAIEAIELGAYKYLTKPVDTGLLASVVGRAVMLSRLGRAKAEAFSVLGSSSGRASDRVGLSAALERALDGLWPAFQPIVSASDGSLFGYEALMRCDDPALPHPGAILDAAERLGKLQVLGRTMRERACARFLEAEEGLSIFLNLHPLDLLDPELIDPDCGTSACAPFVVLEVTERATLDQVPNVRERVSALRRARHRIAVDDLGAGYAGLTSFVELEPDFVKLDMSLIRDVDQSRVKQGLVRSMTTLSKEMGLSVVAEGIETESERDTVIALGVDLLQGYRFGKPDREFRPPKW